MDNGNETATEEPLVKRRSRFEPECLFFTGQFASRFLILLFTFTAICLIAIADDALSRIGFRLLLCADAIVFCYTLLSFAWFWSPYSRESSFNMYTGPFYCDMVAAMVLTFGCNAVARAGHIAQQGQHGTSWFSLCNGVCTNTMVALDLSRSASLIFLNLGVLVICRLVWKAYT